MDWRTIPEKLYIGAPSREEAWIVRWREASDPRWVEEEADGLTEYEARTISLDERLKHDPSRLHTVWVHELCHAAFHYWRNRRPRVFGEKLEETVISALTPILSRALAQCGG